MSRVVLCLAALVVAAAAFPSNTFVKIDTYSTPSACAAATTTPTSTSYYAVDLCTVQSASNPMSSRKFVFDNNMNNVVAWTYTGSTTCTGTGTSSGSSNYTVGGCGTSSQRATTLASSVGLYSTTSYSDTSCNTLASGPSFLREGCSSGTSVTVGGKLEICFGGSQTDCSGGQCVSLSHGECNEAQSGGQSSSVAYDWNAASAATPAVALTAALIAVVAAVTKF